MYKPIKSLGQNFLNNSQIVDKMVRALDIKESDVIIEIGPGHGILTQSLVDRAMATNSELFAVEIDERFYKKLESMYVYEESIHMHHGDILNWLPEYKPPEHYKIIGSLPYYITSPILHTVIRKVPRADMCVFLIQKEVAERINETAPKATYLSSYVQTFYNVAYLGQVKKNVFHPKPKVDGAIIKFEKKEIDFPEEEILRYEGFLHKGFANPRKMLNKAFNDDELFASNIDPRLRPQNLSPQQWLNFYKVLHK